MEKWKKHLKILASNHKNVPTFDYNGASNFTSLGYVFQYLSRDYAALVEALEPQISVKTKEELATTLVKVLQKMGVARDFLSDIVMTEVLKLGRQAAIRKLFMLWSNIVLHWIVLVWGDIWWILW